MSSRPHPWCVAGFYVCKLKKVSNAKKASGPVADEQSEEADEIAAEPQQAEDVELNGKASQKKRKISKVGLETGKHILGRIRARGDYVSVVQGQCNFRSLGFYDPSPKFLSSSMVWTVSLGVWFCCRNLWQCMMHHTRETSKIFQQSCCYEIGWLAHHRHIQQLWCSTSVLFRWKPGRNSREGPGWEAKEETARVRDAEASKAGASRGGSSQIGRCCKHNRAAWRCSKWQRGPKEEEKQGEEVYNWSISCCREGRRGQIVFSREGPPKSHWRCETWWWCLSEGQRREANPQTGSWQRQKETFQAMIYLLLSHASLCNKLTALPNY